MSMSWRIWRHQNSTGTHDRSLHGRAWRGSYEMHWIANSSMYRQFIHVTLFNNSIKCRLFRAFREDHSKVVHRLVFPPFFCVSGKAREVRKSESKLRKEEYKKQNFVFFFVYHLRRKLRQHASAPRLLTKGAGDPASIYLTKVERFYWLTRLLEGDGNRWFTFHEPYYSVSRFQVA